MRNPELCEIDGVLRGIRFDAAAMERMLEVVPRHDTPPASRVQDSLA